MTLQASGAISLSEIQTEFGGSNPIAINEYINYRTSGKQLGTGGLSFSDFYEGDVTPLYKTILTVSNSDYGGSKIVTSTYTTGPDNTIVTNTPTSIDYAITKLYGFDNDADYLDPISNTAANTITTWYQVTDTFGSLGTITRTGSFASIVIHALYWSDQFDSVYMILSNTSDPAFISVTINGNAYRKDNITENITSSRNESAAKRIYRWSVPSTGNPFGTTGTIQIWIT